MNKEVEKFENLLIEFNKISKQIPREPTFLEIRGSSHLENLSSNLLSFYFDTREVHNLKDLMLKSLFETLGNSFIEQVEMEVLNVETEVLTKDNKRIDLLIETESHIIVIENKIWHTLKNPLNEYSNYINENYKGKKQIKLILSMDGLKEDEDIYREKENFKQITHSNLYGNVRKRIRTYTSEANQKYLTYLIDYMNSNENLMKEEPVNIKLLKFYTQNFTKIAEFEERVNLAKKANKKRIETVANKLNAALVKQNDKLNISQWIWKYVLVHDFTLENGYVLTLDCIFLAKIEIIFWIRKGEKSKDKLREFSFCDDNTKTNHLDRLVCYEKENFDLGKDSDDLVEKLKNIITAINEEADAIFS